jgi:tripartite motif-containing protein 71
MRIRDSIATDKNRRVYVADRSNKRIQVFDENGKFLDMWPNMTSPYTILMSKDQHLWVGDGTTNRISKYDENGKFLYGWGISAEVWSGRVQKFRPKKGADPAKLVQSELRWPTT